MAETVPTVIKKHRVRPAPAHPVWSEGDPDSLAGRGEVRLAQKHADRAVLEVRCVCGNVMYVECRWPTAEPEAPGPAPGAEAAPASAAEPQPNEEATR